MFGELAPVLELSLDICATASRVLVVWSVVYHHVVSVTALPETAPVIYTEHDRYEPGDTLRANCSSPPSKPAASLSFFLNNIPVSTRFSQHSLNVRLLCFMSSIYIYPASKMLSKSNSI
jgi:hypothetical protein